MLSRVVKHITVERDIEEPGELGWQHEVIMTTILHF